MFEIVLYTPEIPPNTGNVMRLSANTGSRLHLIHPLGFEMDDKRLRRAGMDYRDRAVVTEHADWVSFVESIAPPRVFAFTQKASQPYSDIAYRPGDALVFGPESIGLPDVMLEDGSIDKLVTIPMTPGGRSLNLSNAVAVVTYEAWRQNGFAGA